MSVNGNTSECCTTISDDVVVEPNPPMFQVADPISNVMIDLDDLFNDFYWTDLPTLDPVPDPLLHSTGDGYDGPSAASDDVEKKSSSDMKETTQQERMDETTPPDLDVEMVSSSSSSDIVPKRKRPSAEDNNHNGNRNPDHHGTMNPTPDGHKSSPSVKKARTQCDATVNGTTSPPPDVPLTQEQLEDRRERNREHAKRSRLRKRFLLDSLQQQIHILDEQIRRLKEAIQTEIPDRAQDIIKQVCGDRGKYIPLPMPSGFGPVKTLMEPDFRLMSALTGSQQNFVISDPTMSDNPIVYVSQGFLELTGYTLDQALGRNCRFLQGPATDQAAVDVIRQGIADGVDTSVCLLNYRADGTTFWNHFFVAALRDSEDNIVNYVGVQCEVSQAVVEKYAKEPLTEPKRHYRHEANL